MSNPTDSPMPTRSPESAVHDSISKCMSTALCRSASSVDHGGQYTAQNARNVSCICDSECTTRKALCDPGLQVVSKTTQFAARVFAHHDASAPSPIQINAVLTLGLCFMARVRSSEVIWYRPKLASWPRVSSLGWAIIWMVWLTVIAMTNQSSSTR